ncbi:MAG TPA: hypothetical protein VKA48_10710 [Gammaproteobacteria bacterium]|nr:hypothetical protein [Gammaproteobacteria bacterium]
MSKRRITAELLAQEGACPDQLDRFQERFPDGIDPETVQPEEVVGLDVLWAVLHMLPAPAREVFKEAAWKAFREARATEWEAYKEGGASALARKAYKEATDAAWEAYDEAKARIAIELFREYWQ